MAKAELLDAATDDEHEHEHEHEDNDEDSAGVGGVDDASPLGFARPRASVVLFGIFVAGVLFGARSLWSDGDVDGAQPDELDYFAERGAEDAPAYAEDIDGFHLPATAMVGEVELAGSRGSIEGQHRAAVRDGARFFRTGKELRRAAERGRLVEIRESKRLELSDVSHPYSHPQTARLLQLLARGHHRACGLPLVVTSMSRPLVEQPTNASDLSVHPAGRAFDLRSGIERSCRRWLENTLLDLEKRGWVDVTLERRPPHFHVATFPARLRRQSKQHLVRALGLGSQGANKIARTPTTGPSKSSGKPDTLRHPVVTGDSLWRIADRYDCSIEDLVQINQLDGDTIYAGQTLLVPAR